MRLAVTGFRTTIVQEMLKRPDVTVLPIQADLSRPDAHLDIPAADCYVLAAGVLVGQRIWHLTPDEFMGCLSVNLINVIRICEQVLGNKLLARIVVIGSESATNGSFDQAYAVSKAGLHAYILGRRVTAPQQLVCVSPSIIWDSGMTQRRPDRADLRAQGRAIVTAADVAATAWELLLSTNPVSNLIYPVTRTGQGETLMPPRRTI